MILNQFFFGVSSEAAPSAVTAAWIAKVVSLGGSVAADEKRCVNDFTLTSEFPKLDVCVLNGARNKTASCVNISNPEIVLEDVDSPLWIPKVGISKGTAGYQDTHYNPLTQGVQFQKNNCFTGLYCTNVVVDAGSNQDLAAYTDSSGSGCQLLVCNNVGHLVGAANTDNIVGVGNNLSEGLFCQGRTDAVDAYVVLDGVKNSSPNAVVDIPDLNLFLLSLNYNDAAVTHSVQTVAITLAGAGDIDHAQLKIDIQQLVTGLNISRFFYLTDTEGNFIYDRQTGQKILTQ